ETGKITSPLDKTESWFSEYGDAKGLCFNADGTKIFVTFESDKPLSQVKKLFRALASDRDLPVPTRLMNFSRKLKNRIRAFNYSLREVHSETSETSVELEKPNPQYVKPTKNGIAIFSISAEGKIARHPEHVTVQKDFCRLENLDVFDGTCAVTDTVNHQL